MGLGLSLRKVFEIGDTVSLNGKFGIVQNIDEGAPIPKRMHVIFKDGSHDWFCADGKRDYFDDEPSLKLEEKGEKVSNRFPEFIP